MSLSHLCKRVVLVDVEGGRIITPRGIRYYENSKDNFLKFVNDINQMSENKLILVPKFIKLARLSSNRVNTYGTNKVIYMVVLELLRRGNKHKYLWRGSFLKHFYHGNIELVQKEIKPYLTRVQKYKYRHEPGMKELLIDLKKTKEILPIDCMLEFSKRNWFVTRNTL